MAYDHARKIGNKGDVFKHAILARVASELAAEDFVYLETHAGRAEYVLPERGAWQSGIAEFATSRAMRDARVRWRAQQIAPAAQTLRVYDELCLGGRVNVAQKYPGSAGLVFRLLRSRGIESPSMLLHDQGADVVDDLRRYFMPWPTVQIFQGDGYPALAAALEQNAQLSLVLLDPFDVRADAARLVQAMQMLLEHNRHFLCWTPLHQSGTNANTPSQACLAVRIPNTTTSAVRWQNWSGQMCGCQVVASAGIAPFVTETAAQIRAATGWAEA